MPYIFRIEVIDTAILRPGRFGKLHYVSLPSQEERALILKALGRRKPLDPDVDLNFIAQMEACKDLSGADLAALVCPILLSSLIFSCGLLF